MGVGGGGGGGFSAKEFKNEMAGVSLSLLLDVDQEMVCCGVDRKF